ncbi:MAG: DUF805 domain-containing protein [Wenzhouxiangellaceae bacterium]
MQENNPYQAPSADLNAPLHDGDIDTSSPLSISGRFGRLSYMAWMAVIGLVFTAVMTVVLVAAGGSILDLMMTDPDAVPAAGTLLLLLVLYIPVLVVAVIFNARRLHDMNMSGWWQLAIIVPIANLILFLALLVMPGTAGFNRFGPPRPTQTWESILAIIYIVMFAGSIAFQFYIFTEALNSPGLADASVISVAATRWVV